MSSEGEIPDIDAPAEEELNCGSGGGSPDFLGLRIAAIFVILVASTAGALFPVLAKRTKLRVPKGVFDFAKFFGSGVIIATAFIHLLAPGLEALGNPCLAEGWSDYPYALGLALLSIFVIFLVELIAFRWGTAKLSKIGLQHDAHGHNAMASHSAHGPEGEVHSQKVLEEAADEESLQKVPSHILDNVVTQCVGIAILEFGVALHSILIGLTLAVDEDFKILFVVLVFHQTFEGLGLGARLSMMGLPQKYNYVPILGALLYGITTPVGIAAGLGVRTTYNPESTTAAIVSGVMDSLSAGILIYTGLVELLAHDFLFSKEMLTASNWDLAYAVGSMMLGCGLMALLGRWA